MDAATPVREELGVPLRCHFTVLDRWRERPGSQAFFGFGSYPYNGRRYWWLHSWLIDSTGTSGNLDRFGTGPRQEHSLLRRAVELGITSSRQRDTWASV